MNTHQQLNQSSLNKNDERINKAKIEEQQDKSAKNQKYFTPERIKNSKLDQNQLQTKLIRSLSNKTQITKTEPSFSNQNVQNNTSTQSNSNININKLNDKNKDLNASRNQHQLKNTYIQQYINNQIQNKLSNGISGGNQKEIYPSKQVTSLKTQQIQNNINSFRQNPSNLLKKREGYNKEQSTLIDKKGNSQNIINISKENNDYSIEHANIYNVQKQKEVLKLQNRDNEKQNIETISKNDDIQKVDKYKLNNDIKIVQKGNIKNLRMKSQEQDREKNQSKNEEIKIKENKNQNELMSTVDKQKQFQLQRRRINQSLDHQKLNDFRVNKQNNIGSQQIDNRRDSLQKQTVQCASEQRIKTDSSQQTDCTTKACSIMSKSPESIQNNQITQQQKSISKKLLEKIKINRHYQASHHLQQAAASSIQFPETNSNQNNNLQIIQQAQRINKFAEYIKQDCYIQNQELRPNKPQVRLLVERILKMYQFLLNLSQERDRIAIIMKECGAAKGRLIEIFFQNSNLSLQPLKEDMYYNKYLDTIEKSVINDNNIDSHMPDNNNTVYDSFISSNKTPNLNVYQDFKLVENLEPKHFYNKTYFKVLQKDRNGVVYVQEYIDLQVIEDLDNLKTTLSFCLQYTEDTSQKTESSKSPTLNKKVSSQNIQIRSQQNQSRNDSPDNVSKDQSNINKVSSPFEVKINKYEEKKQVIKIKYPSKKELKKNQTEANDNNLREQPNQSQIKQILNKKQNQLDKNEKQKNGTFGINEEDANSNDIKNQNKLKNKNFVNTTSNYIQSELKQNSYDKQKDSFNNTKLNQNQFTSQQDDIQDFLDLQKDLRNERKGIISEIREFSQINEGIKIPSYITTLLQFDINNYIDYDISNYN